MGEYTEVFVRYCKPPVGFIKFDMRGETSDTIVCPACHAKGKGILWYGHGWTDPEMQKRSEQYDGYIDDLELKEHPSRFFLGKFMCCEAEIWHNNERDGYKCIYYYKPKSQEGLNKWF